MTSLKAYGADTIKSANIDALNIDYIDMHDNLLGDTNNSISIKGSALTTTLSRKRGNIDTREEWDISYLNLKGNGIKLRVWAGDNCSGSMSIYVKIGYGLEPADIVLYIYAEAGGLNNDKDNSSTYYYHLSDGKSHYISDSGHRYNTSVSIKTMSIEDGELMRFLFNYENEWANDGTRYIDVWPFGK